METLFDFTEQVGHKRRPDLAFVSKDRWPLTREPPDRDGWPVVPNLAIEVVSRSNLWEDGWEKIGEYFQVGVERVWAIGLKAKQIHVYDSPSCVRILGVNDVLTDESLLPGFRLQLHDLFLPATAEASETPETTESAEEA